MKVYVHDYEQRGFVYQAIESVKALGLDYVVISDRVKEKAVRHTGEYHQDLIHYLNEEDDAIILEDDDILVKVPKDRGHSYHVKPFVLVEDQVDPGKGRQVVININSPWHNVSSFYIKRGDVRKLKELLSAYDDSYGIDKVMYECMEFEDVTDPLYTFTAWRFHSLNISLYKPSSYYREKERKLDAFIRKCLK